MIKGIQVADQEMKIVNFADDTTIFLWDITCLNIMQVILKLYENAKMILLKIDLTLFEK